jgi:hypothetical protein
VYNHNTPDGRGEATTVINDSLSSRYNNNVNINYHNGTDGRHDAKGEASIVSVHHIYIYIYIYVYIYIYIYISLYIFLYIYIYIYIYIYVYIYIHICLYIYMYILYIHVFIYKCI